VTAAAVLVLLSVVHRRCGNSSHRVAGILLLTATRTITQYTIYKCIISPTISKPIYSYSNVGAGLHRPNQNYQLETE